MKIRPYVLAAAAALCCLLVTGRAQADSIFLEIPGVPGEVVTPAVFAGQIELSSMQLGGGGGVCVAHPSFSEIVVTKIEDKATVPLYAALRDHTVYGTATIRFVRSADNQVSQTYVLTNAVVTGVSTSSGGGRPSESLSLGFSQLLMTYTFFDGSGKAGATQSTTLVNAACP